MVCLKGSRKFEIIENQLKDFIETQIKDIGKPVTFEMIKHKMTELADSTDFIYSSEWLRNFLFTLPVDRQKEIKKFTKTSKMMKKMRQTNG